MKSELKLQRLSLLVVAILVIALAAAALAACGGDEGTTDEGGETVESVKIGTLFPMTGDLAKTGAQAVNGAKMAVDEINAAGGIKSLGGAKLELDVANTQGKPEVGMAEAERVINQENVIAVIGTSMSGLAVPISQKTERLATPFIVCDAIANEITERGYKYTFRLIPKADSWAKFQVEFLTEVAGINPDFGDIKRVATIHEDSDYGVGMSESQQKWLKEAGLEHTIDVSYPYTATDLTTQVSKLKASDPDAVLVSSYLTDAMVLAQARERLEMMDIPFIDGGGGVLDPNFPATLGDTAEYWFSITDFLPNANEESIALAKDFQEKFNLNMNSNANWGYTSIYIFAKALENAGSADRDALRQALTEVELDRANGDRITVPLDVLRFNEEGQLDDDALYMGQILDGELTAVYPEALATKDVVAPK